MLAEPRSLFCAHLLLEGDLDSLHRLPSVHQDSVLKHRNSDEGLAEVVVCDLFTGLGGIGKQTSWRMRTDNFERLCNKFHIISRKSCAAHHTAVSLDPRSLVRSLGYLASSTTVRMSQRSDQSPLYVTRNQSPYTS